MFGMGWSEIILIGVIALIVIGPNDFPKMFRKMGEFTGKARVHLGDVLFPVYHGRSIARQYFRLLGLFGILELGISKNKHMPPPSRT